ncbi:hypothetical protein ABMC89_09650 [Sulfitobacter sp. HNIBRBA3233]
MFTIYANTFMNATRTGKTRLHDIPSVSGPKRRRWFTRRTLRVPN